MAEICSNNFHGSRTYEFYTSKATLYVVADSCSNMVLCCLLRSLSQPSAQQWTQHRQRPERPVTGCWMCLISLFAITINDKGIAFDSCPLGSGSSLSEFTLKYIVAREAKKRRSRSMKFTDLMWCTIYLQKQICELNLCSSNLIHENCKIYAPLRSWHYSYAEVLLIEL